MTNSNLRYIQVQQQWVLLLQLIQLPKTAKGAFLTSITPVASGTTAIVDFSDLTFGTATVTARGAMIFNEVASGDPAVCVVDFGGDKTSTAGNFTIVFPAANATAAIIRLA